MDEADPREFELRPSGDDADEGMGEGRDVVYLDHVPVTVGVNGVCCNRRQMGADEEEGQPRGW